MVVDLPDPFGPKAVDLTDRHGQVEPIQRAHLSECLYETGNLDRDGHASYARPPSPAGDARRFVELRASSARD
jgi:hypothetical protein